MEALATILLPVLAFLGALLFGPRAWAATRGRTFKYNPRVERWSDEVAYVQAEVGTDIPTPVVLAIIQVESEGNPKAHRPGSQFYGLTQVGKALASETRTDRAVMGRGGLRGGREAIRAFCRWAKMYRSLHRWDPELMALGWKGGVGTLDDYNARVRAGEDQAALRTWLDKKRWGTWKYVRKFRAAFSIWNADDPRSAPAVTVR